MTKISKEERLVAVKAIEEGKSVTKVQHNTKSAEQRWDYYNLYQKHGQRGCYAVLVT